MKRFTCHDKKGRFAYIKVTLFFLFLGALTANGFTTPKRSDDAIFQFYVNGNLVGYSEDASRLEELYLTARREVASKVEELLFIEPANLSYLVEQRQDLNADTDETILRNMQQIITASVHESVQKAYTVKVNEYTVDLKSAREVAELLNAALNKYDKYDQFTVELTQDFSRNVNVLTANVHQQETPQLYTNEIPQGGVQAVISHAQTVVYETGEKDFEDFDLGMRSMNFAQEVEVVEAYLPGGQITPLEEAINEVTLEEEKNTIYVVQAGDTLSEIAMIVNIPMDRLVELNDTLTDVNTMIRQGQELIVTVPEAKLSVEWSEENYYEEIYDAPVVYIDNDSWYTTQTKTHQEPSAGFRKVIANEYYENDKLVRREIVKEEIVMEAIAKIVERGTKIPPTYIKPLSGGRLSSGFGKRNSPTPGASTYHKGTDWATPTGTAIFASSGGVVARAGWGSGYGYVIYIDHPDGRQTRYGHLSKILVKVGQSVKQGDRIALSGNTGVSSGPHVHFEILIKGKQVNPLNYIN
ncbi:MAG: peptidoglycan DD-metalloendopeptidase family protein [Clostridium sp.]|nr:peptidoglycan DD-metalloendopeptidase family protein [Clostridium sp.]